MKKSLDTHYCPYCGSANVSVIAWVNANTHKFEDYTESVYEGNPGCCWCNNCEGPTELVTLKELWKTFTQIPADSDGKIKEAFMNFPKGTHRLNIVNWFGKRCPNLLKED